MALSVPTRRKPAASEELFDGAKLEVKIRVAFGFSEVIGQVLGQGRSLRTLLLDEDGLYDPSHF
ncbi:MAG: hypothetical protein HY319_25225 [Armatimonadetes bacterium]|nr:hypothetical protein [Armatimonadota bacterium]